MNILASTIFVYSYCPEIVNCFLILQLIFQLQTNTTIMKNQLSVFFLTCAWLLLPFIVTGSNTTPRNDNGWTIVNQFSIHNNAGGLASDGNVLFIGGLYGNVGHKVYTFDPVTHELQLLFDGPQDNTLGLTFDGQHLWTIEQTGASTPAQAWQIDLEGNLVSQFDLPGSYMSGIAWDDGNFYVATYFPNPGTIHYVDDQGNEISSFTPPSNQPWDLALQGDSLWIVDFWNDFIHLVELDGTLIESFPYDDHRATGIYHDGTFLWYIGRTSTGVSTLYQVDPWGSGTPVIQVPPSYHFGNVTLGNSEDWVLTILNTGTGDLVVNDITFPENNGTFSVDADLPITIEPDAGHAITVTFTPQDIHLYESTMTIHSNDPASPEVDIILEGNGLASGPYLTTVADLIDFGDRRINSSTRGFLELKNMGDSQLLLEDIDFSVEDYWWDWTVEFPITLSPVQSVALPFWFQPLTAGVVDGEAILYFNNEEQSPYTIELTGYSEDIDYPLATVLWDLHLPGSSFDNPRAILPVPDVNDDGVDDVVICTRGLRIMMFNGNASGTPDLLWETEVGTVEYAKGIVLTDDLNDDGFHDIIIGTAYGDRAVTALSSRTGEIIWRFETNLYGGGGWVYMVDASYDYNGNGYRDVLAATGDDGQGTGPRRVFLLNGLTGEMIWDTPMGGAAYSVLAVQDFTGDGVPDVVAGGQTPGQQGRVLGINGANGAIIWELATSGSSVWALEQINDITDNGINDVIIGTFNGHYYLVDVTNGEIVYSGNLGNSLIVDFWQAGDLNGDGYMDILPSYSTVKMARAISGKDGQILWSTPIADQGWAVTSMRDITGDGINDVAVGTLFQTNYLYFLAGADGQVLDSIPMPDAVDIIRAIPDVTGDNSMEVVAGARNRYVAAFSGGTKVADEYYNVTFLVTDDQTPANPLQGATIVIQDTGYSLTTDEEGLATVELVQAEYLFTVSKDGYYPHEDTFLLEGEDKTVEVALSTDDTGIQDILDPKVVRAYNYPNPFSEYTNIIFTLNLPTQASIYVYDMSGRKFNILQNRSFPAGENAIQWNGSGPDGSPLVDGIYIFEIRTRDSIYRDRMFILR